MRRYWLPYEQSTSSSWCRWSLDRRFRVHVYLWADWKHDLLNVRKPSFESSQEAMQDLDRCLVERGDYLIPEDKVEAFKQKLMVLL
jgi:hypothetical protein